MYVTYMTHIKYNDVYIVYLYKYSEVNHTTKCHTTIYGVSLTHPSSSLKVPLQITCTFFMLFLFFTSSMHAGLGIHRRVVPSVPSMAMQQDRRVMHLGSRGLMALLGSSFFLIDDVVLC